MHGEVPADRERLTMVVLTGRIVAEICFRRKVGIGSRPHCFLRRGMQELAISSIDAGGNDDKTLGVREGWNEMAWVKGEMKV